MRWFFVLGFFILLFFIPIPIKIRLIYKDKILNLYLYSFKININKKIKNIKEKLPKPPKKKKAFDKDFLTFDNIKIILHRIKSSRFKPTLRLSIGIEYGLIDAFSTGIAYGVFHSFSPFIYEALSVPFKTKRYKLNLKPNFNQLELAAVIESIIFINLAKIIYMAIIVLITIRKIKKADKYACANA
jgi:hypothetical protein